MCRQSSCYCSSGDLAGFIVIGFILIGAAAIAYISGIGILGSYLHQGLKYQHYKFTNCTVKTVSQYVDLYTCYNHYVCVWNMSSPILPPNATASLEQRQAYKTPACESHFQVNQTIPCFVLDSYHPITLKNDGSKLKTGAIGIGIMVGIPVLASIITGLVFAIVELNRKCGNNEGYESLA